MKRKGFVYLLCDGEKFKIGMTTKSDIHERISELQTGNPNEIFLAAYHKTNEPFKIERLMHMKYFGRRVKNEWFDLTAEDVVNFNKNCEHYEMILDSLKDNVFFS